MPDLLKNHTPSQKYWVLFKISSKKRIQQMRDGLIYMNSLSFFSNMEGTDYQALRKDSFEDLFLKITTDKYRKQFFEINYDKSHKKNNLKIPVDMISISVPDAKNTMIFSMSTISEDKNGMIPGEKDGVLRLDERMLLFGTHILLITNAPEFSLRINNAMYKSPHIYGLQYFPKNYGMVDYRNFDKESGYIGIFRKDKKYAWQREFRFCFGVKDKGLNKKGAFELNIGDISDISTVIPLKNILDEPFKIKRKRFQLVNGEYIQVF